MCSRIRNGERHLVHADISQMHRFFSFPENFAFFATISLHFLHFVRSLKMRKFSLFSRNFALICLAKIFVRWKPYTAQRRKATITRNRTAQSTIEIQYQIKYKLMFWFQNVSIFEKYILFLAYVFLLKNLTFYQ